MNSFKGKKIRGKLFRHTRRAGLPFQIRRRTYIKRQHLFKHLHQVNNKMPYRWISKQHRSRMDSTISQHILENLDDKIIIVDMKTLTIYSSNNAARKVGIIPGISLYKHYKWGNILKNTEIYHSKDVNKSMIKRTIDVTRVNKKGQVRYEVINIIPLANILDNHQLVGFIVQDVTKITETILRLQSLYRQAMIHIDVMRHDLINVFQILSSAAELLSYNHDFVESSHNVDIIISSIARAVNLIRKLHWVDTDQNDKSDLVLLDDAIDIAINLITRIFFDVPINVSITTKNIDTLVDSHFSEAIKAILENAIVHNNQEHPIIWIEIYDRDNNIVVSIADNGPGFSDSMKLSVLDPTKRISGTGLHRALEIVKKNHGTLAIEDRICGKQNSGTKVIITLPKYTSGEIINHQFRKEK